MNKRMIWMLVAVTVVFGGLFGMKWFGNKMMNQFFDTMPVPPATVTSAEVTVQRWPDITTAVGSVVASQGTQISTESAGTVTAIHVASGARVARGDRLVTLNADTERANVRRLEAQVAQVARDQARLARLFALEAIARADLDAVESQLAALRAELGAEQARLAQKEIRAPFAGQLGIRQVSVGDYLTAGQPIIALQALDAVYIDFTVPEAEAQRLKPGQRVLASPDGVDTPREGVIEALDSRIDEATRNLKVRARFDNRDRVWVPGAFARVRVERGADRDVLAIPRSAVSYNPYGNSVFVIVPQSEAADAPLIVRQRFITTGAAEGDLISVTDGLKAGDRIATTGLLKLRNDAVVVINNTVQPGAALNPTPGDG